MKNEEVLQRVKEERNILHTVKRRKANWIGHTLCRNCLPKHITEGNTEGKVGGIGRHKQLLDDLKEQRGYWKLKEGVLDCMLQRTCFGRGYGPVTRQTAGSMNGSSCTTLVRDISGAP